MPTAELHPRAREIAERLAETIREAAGDGVALAVYGSAVREDFDPVRSDIDILIALPDASFDALDKLGPPLREAWRSARVEPYLVMASELPRLADVFPIRVLDIQRKHVMVLGEDPLAGVEVEPAHLRLRIEQELRNRLLRTRRRVVSAAGDPLSMTQLVRRVSRALRLELWALLVLVGEEPESLSLRAVFAAASNHFDLDTSFLTRLAEMSEGGEVADPPAAVATLLTLLEQLVELADREAKP